jgi:phosphatidylserine decarboxylase
MKTLLFKESIEVVVFLCVLMIIFKNNNYIFTLCLIILGSLCFFYRIPERSVPVIDDSIILSPSDGTILKISETKDKMYKISVYLSIFDVHTQWYPTNGLVRNVIYKKGEFNLAHILEKSDYNEKMTTIIQHTKGMVRIDQIAGQIARRIVNWSTVNTEVTRGNLMGMIKLSSRVDIYLPIKKVKLFININDSMIGNTTPIAKWI